MQDRHSLAGVYAAAVTPLKSDSSPDLEAMAGLLDFLALRGCQGALVLGTTGEGPSFSPLERLDVMKAAIKSRPSHTDFQFMAGTGTPSLEETIELTKAAFDLGYDAVVVLPPYYYRKASVDGLFEWFSQVITRAVPPDGRLLAYHIPPYSGMSVSIELLHRLKDKFPERFAGLKDSSTEAGHARLLGEEFGNSLLVFNGNDSLFSLALQSHASGCITALANLCSPLLRRIWDHHIQGEKDEEGQSRLNPFRELMDSFSPVPAFLKTILAYEYHFPEWGLKPPLTPLSPEKVDEALQAWDRLVNV